MSNVVMLANNRLMNPIYYMEEQIHNLLILTVLGLHHCTTSVHTFHILDYMQAVTRAARHKVCICAQWPCLLLSSCLCAEEYPGYGSK